MKYLIPIFLIIINCISNATWYPIQIPTRVEQADKKYLSANIYSTDTTISKPVILIQTPYNKDYYHFQSYIPSLGGGVNIFVDTVAYNFVVVDWRGFYGSKDADIANYNRGLDGYDIVEWIATQKWSNGKIGTYGGSALGQIQFLTASEHPPHLVCAVPMIKDFKSKYSDYYYGGDYRKEHVESLVKLGFTTEQIILAHPTKDNLWIYLEKTNDYADVIEIPMLLISGWFDHYPTDVIRAFHDLRTTSNIKIRNEHKLIFGPWLHMAVGEENQGILFFPEAVGIPVEASRKFFDYYLRNAKNGWILEPPTQYFEIGTNTWKTADDWLTLNRTNDTLYLNKNSELTFSLNNSPQDYDILNYDPKNPSPTFGGSRFNPFDKTIPIGPQDQKQIVESRNDILVYSTGKLQTDLKLSGSVVAELFLSCDKEDTDYGIRLCDEDTDGKSILLTQGIKRMRFRNSYSTQELMKKDSIYKVSIELENLCYVFKKGHELKIILSGSNYPMFDINLNNGGELYKPGDTLSAKSLVYRNMDYPSRIILPSISEASEVENSSEINHKINIFPNPAKEIVNLNFRINETSNVKISICDLLGLEVLDYGGQIFNQGQYNLELNLGSIAKGVYFLKFVSGKNIFIEKIVRQ